MKLGRRKAVWAMVEEAQKQPSATPVQPVRQQEERRSQGVGAHTVTPPPVEAVVPARSLPAPVEAVNGERKLVDIVGDIKRDLGIEGNMGLAQVLSMAMETLELPDEGTIKQKAHRAARELDLPIIQY